MNVLDAFYETVTDYPGGFKSLAPRLGISAQVLRNKADPDCTTNKPLLVEADRIMSYAKDYRILHALAENHGFVCYKMESDQPVGDAALVDLMAGTMKSGGDVGAAVMVAIADGKVERVEVERVAGAIYTQIQALQCLLAGLKDMAED